MTAPRLFLTRKEAGRLKAKKTGSKGGKELYSIAALEAWFEGLIDA